MGTHLFLCHGHVHDGLCAGNVMYSRDASVLDAEILKDNLQFRREASIGRLEIMYVHPKPKASGSLGVPQDSTTFLSLSHFLSEHYNDISFLTPE